MDICVLNSGSSGNSIYISSKGTSILIDAGLSYKQLSCRMTDANISPESISAVLITHSHSDHYSALARFLKLYPNLEVYANAETADAIDRLTAKETKNEGLPWTLFETGQKFNLGPFQITPFTVQHDTDDPVAFVISDGEKRIAVATDLGMVTKVVKYHLSDLDALVLEANYDPEMLQHSDRLPSTIQRIQSERGHLANYQAAELLSEIATPKMKYVFPAHISGECNTIDLAEMAFRLALKEAGLYGKTAIKPTYRDKISEFVTI